MSWALSILVLKLMRITVAEYSYVVSANGSYALIDEALTWYTANEYCNDNFGTSLATIRYDNEFNQAQELCLLETTDGDSSHHFCWIGLTDLYTEAEWKWIDDITSFTNENVSP